MFWKWKKQKPIEEVIRETNNQVHKRYNLEIKYAETLGDVKDAADLAMQKILNAVDEFMEKTNVRIRGIRIDTNVIWPNMPWMNMRGPDQCKLILDENDLLDSAWTKKEYSNDWDKAGIKKNHGWG